MGIQSSGNPHSQKPHSFMKVWVVFKYTCEFRLEFLSYIKKKKTIARDIEWGTPKVNEEIGKKVNAREYS